MKLFVGNLSFAVTKEGLEGFLQAHRIVVNKIEMPTDHETGATRGFAFVEPASAEDEKKLRGLDGLCLDARHLRIKDAKPPKSRYQTQQRHLAGARQW